MNYKKTALIVRAVFLCAYILPRSAAKSRPLQPRDGFDMMNMR